MRTREEAGVGGHTPPRAARARPEGGTPDAAPPSPGTRLTLRERITRARQRRRDEWEREDQALRLAAVGFERDVWGIHTVHLAEDAPCTFDIIWPAHPGLYLRVSETGAVFHRGAAPPEELPRTEALQELQLALGLSPVETESAERSRRVMDAIRAIPVELTGMALGSVVVETQYTGEQAELQLRHANRRVTRLVVDINGVTFGPWNLRRGGWMLRRQYINSTEWAVNLAAALGIPMNEDLPAPLFAPPPTLDVRASCSTELWEYYSALLRMVDPAVLTNPTFAITVARCGRQMEVSARMEALLHEVFQFPAPDGGTRLLWYPELRVDDLEQASTLPSIGFLMWLAGIHVPSVAVRARLCAASDAAAAVRATPLFAATGALPDAVWADLMLPNSELASSDAKRAALTALNRTRPSSALTRDLYWSMVHDTNFTRAGGVIRHSAAADEAVGDNWMVEATRANGDGMGYPPERPYKRAGLATTYRTLILDAAMGTHKSVATRYFLRSFLRINARGNDMRVLVVTPRRKFAAAMHGELGGAGFKNYCDIRGTLERERLLICQAESLHRLGAPDSAAFQDFDIVILDEISSTLPQMTVRETHRAHHRENAAWFERLCRNARVLIAADAFLTPAVEDFLFYMRSNAVAGETARGTRLPGAYLFRLAHVPPLGPATKVRNYAQLLIAIQERAVEGALARAPDGSFQWRNSRLVIVSASRDKAEGMERMITGWNEHGAPVLARRREAVAAALAAEGDDTNADDILRPLRVKIYKGAEASDAELRNVAYFWSADEADVVIYTPAVTVGISYSAALPRNMFDHLFFYGSAASCSVREQIQMLRRVRNFSTPGVTYTLEARGRRPVTESHADAVDSIAKHVQAFRTALAWGDLPEEYHTMPHWLMLQLAWQQAELAACRWAFADVMTRYLQLAGYSTAPEPAMLGGGDELLAEAGTASELPPIDDVETPVLDGVTDPDAIEESLRQRHAAGFVLEVKEQLWLSAREVCRLLGGVSEEVRAIWMLSVDPRSGLFRAGFAEVRASVVDPRRRGALERWRLTNYAELAPSQYFTALATAAMESELEKAGVDVRQPVVTVTHAQALAASAALTITWESNFCAAIGAAKCRRKPDAAGAERPMTVRRFNYLLRHLFMACNGARTTTRVVERVRIHAPGAPERRERIREVKIDWRPWLRARALMQSAQTGEPVEDVEPGFWEEILPLWMSRSALDVDEDGAPFPLTQETIGEGGVEV